jgi:hypothetical protein
MRKLIFILLIACTSITHSQNFKGLDKSPLDKSTYPIANKITEKAAILYYSRPQLRGRTLEDIIAPDQIWRTGANESTEIIFNKSVKIGETVIQPGTYSLYSIPSEGSITVIINTAKNTWGAYSYNKENDVVRIDLAVLSSNEKLEALSMVFTGEKNNAKLHMGWEYARVEMPFTIL